MNFHYCCPLYCPRGHYKTARTVYADNKCGICVRAKEKAARLRDPERNAKTQRRAQLKRKFGISVGEYELLLAEQSGRCVGCGVLPGRIRLSVDHDHKNGKIRGLLCNSCNLTLGTAKDSPETLKNLAEYLSKFVGGRLPLAL